MMKPGTLHPSDDGAPTVAPDGQPMASQPQWRRDFPIDCSRDDYVSRRELVKFMILTSGAFVAGQTWLLLKRWFSKAATRSAVVAIARVDDVPVGGALTFTYPAGSTPRPLVRAGPAAFVAYDQQCTHLLCPVVPMVGQGRLHCPCHNGWFDLATGRPVAGPPQRALPRVLVEVRDGTVYATGVEISPAS